MQVLISIKKSHKLQNIVFCKCLPTISSSIYLFKECSCAHSHQCIQSNYDLFKLQINVSGQLKTEWINVAPIETYSTCLKQLIISNLFVLINQLILINKFSWTIELKYFYPDKWS